MPKKSQVRFLKKSYSNVRKEKSLFYEHTSISSLISKARKPKLFGELNNIRCGICSYPFL